MCNSLLNLLDINLDPKVFECLRKQDRSSVDQDGPGIPHRIAVRDADAKAVRAEECSPNAGLKELAEASPPHAEDAVKTLLRVPNRLGRRPIL